MISRGHAPVEMPAVPAGPSTGTGASADPGNSGFAGRPQRWWSLGRLTRVTSSGRFIPEIDGLRFVAVLGVYLYHLTGYVQAKSDRPFRGDPATGPLAEVLVHGNLGVQLFFVISGFILALPFASHYLTGSPRVSLRSYFLRRLTRLEPPYIVSMLMFFVLLVVYVGRSAESLLPRLGASLLYFHNIIYAEGSAINGVAWSLEVEVQFYVLVPALAAIFRVRSRPLRRSLIVAVMALAVAFQWLVIREDTGRLPLTILNHVQFFLLGFLLADIYLVDWRSAPVRTAGWDIVSLIGWPCLALAWQTPPGFRIVFPALLLLLYCAAFRGRWSSRVFSNRWITTIGGMCYTIYLLHYTLISFIGRHTLALRISDDYATELLWQFVLVTPGVLLGSAIFFVLVERPCMQRDWPQRLSATLRRALGAGTSS